MHKIAYAIVVALAAATTTSAASAAVTTFNSLAAFNAASGPTQLEDFNDNTLISGLSITTSAGNIGGGLFNDRVVLSGAQTSFNKAGMTAFGGTYNLTPGGFGQGLAFTLTLNDNSTVSVGSISSYNGFFGFISSDVFKTVTINASTFPGVAETYNLDDLNIGGAVPEPASWAMLISGFGLVGATARRRRAVVAA